MIRPSAICSFPVQKITAGAGTQSVLFIMGSQTIAVAPKDCPSQNKILPLGRRFEFTVTIGKLITLDQIPNCWGCPVELKVTETGLAKPMLFAKSLADAVSV